MDYVVRKAEIGDCPTLAAFLQKLVSLRNEPGLITQNAKDLRRDGFSEEKPKFAAFLAESKAEDKEVIGLALYSFRYASFRGLGLHLNNLFVMEQHRGKGVATQLLKRLIREGLRLGVRNMGFMSNSWNMIAKNLYKKMGAVDLTESKGLHAYELVKPVACEHRQPTEGVVIRKARVEDVPEMTRLLNRFKENQSVCMLESVEEKVLRESGFRRHPKFFTFVAEKSSDSDGSEGQLVGVLTYSHAYCSHSSTTVSLDSVFVEELYRRKGLGCALFRACLQEETAKRHTKVRILVDSSSDTARHFMSHINAVDQTARAQWIWSIVDREDMREYVEEDDEICVNGDLVNGDAKALVNGDAKALVNGDAKALVNGDAKALVNGDAKALVNGDAKALVNGDSKALVNGDAKALVNGDAKPLVNGDAKPLVNGDVKSLVNGNVKRDVKVVVNGDAKPLVNGNVLVNGEINGGI